jgi:hypothetical protein
VARCFGKLLSNSALWFLTVEVRRQ